MLPASYVVPAAVVFAIGGLISCFAGYRLFRFVLGLFGFILGAIVTAQNMGSSNAFTIGMAAIVGGVVGAVLMIVAYFIGVGLVGAGLAALALNTVWQLMGRGDPPTAVLVIVCVIGALAALSISRFVIVFGTALAGSWMFLVGALALMGDAVAKSAASAGDLWMLYPVDPVRWWITPVWLVVAFAGVMAQLATTSKTGKRRVPVVKKSGV